MQFNNKQEYLAYRTQWKMDYAQLSQNIRDVKFAVWYSDSTRSGVKTSPAQDERFKAIAKKHAGQWGFDPNGKKRELKAMATQMIEERKQSKIQAQEQYLKNRQLVTC